MVGQGWGRSRGCKPHLLLLRGGGGGRPQLVQLPGLQLVARAQRRQHALRLAQPRAQLRRLRARSDVANNIFTLALNGSACVSRKLCSTPIIPTLPSAAQMAVDTGA